MGGIFFMRCRLYLILSFISGYLYVSWLPIPKTINFYNIILEFIFNPVKFFVATIAFFIGFILCGIFIQLTVDKIKKTRKKKENTFIEIASILLFLILFYKLFSIGFWQMVLFFSFAAVYGMMTIDKKKPLL